MADTLLDDKLRGLILFVSRLNRASHQILDADTTRLHELGWDDAELIEGIWTACIFNAVVRLVDAFGLSFAGQFSHCPRPTELQ